MPDVNEAFKAEFHFSDALTLDQPEKAHGLIPPPGWGKACRSKHFRWHSRSVETPDGWYTQASDPLVISAVTRKSKQYPAAGNPFTIHVAYPGQKTISTATVQISASTSPDRNSDFVDPPFAACLWGPYQPGIKTSPFPSRSGAMTEIQAPGPFPLSVPAGPDKTGRELFACPLITLLFADATAFTHPKLYIDFAIYLEIDRVKYFDDPEMEIDLGTGDV